MHTLFERLITDPIEEFLNRVLLFFPNLFSAVLILGIGLLVGIAAKYILTRFFKLIKLDNAAEIAGINRAISKSGLQESFSTLLARLIAGVLIFGFLVLSLSTLNVPAIERLLEQLFLYIPNIFVAVLILFLGYLLSNFFGRAALIASVNAELRMAGLIGKVVRLSILLFSLAVALEQLGIGRETVLISFAILFGGTTLAFAIAFGLGGRDAAKAYIEKRLLEETKADEIQYL